MRLTAELRTKIFAAHGICVNEACDKCGKVVGEVRWSRRDMPEVHEASQELESSHDTSIRLST
jgi:hypothetical protein